MLYSLTEDDIKIKITEINEMRKMDVVMFFQLLNTYNDRMDKKISAFNKTKRK